METSSFEIRVLKDESHPFFVVELSSFGQISLHLRYTLFRIRKFFSSNANFHLRAAGFSSSFKKKKTRRPRNGHFMFQFKGCMLEETSYWVCRRPMSIHWCRQYKATRVGGLVQKETNLEWSISTMLAMSQTFLLYPKGGGNCKANIFLAKCTSVAALFPLEDDDAHCCL